jgi:hypothetical protein
MKPVRERPKARIISIEKVDETSLVPIEPGPPAPPDEPGRGGGGGGGNDDRDLTPFEEDARAAAFCDLANMALKKVVKDRWGVRAGSVLRNPYWRRVPDWDEVRKWS